MVFLSSLTGKFSTMRGVVSVRNLSMTRLKHPLFKRNSASSSSSILFRAVNTNCGTDPSDNPVKAILTLEDGTIFEGISFGSEKPVNGEVVFSTGMVGYTESLTDPSYRGQVLSNS